MHEVTCGWKGDMEFAAGIDGHEIILDADAAFGGKDHGPRPKALMLVALAGCTGMDVVSILQKMREPITWFNVRVQSELTSEHPKTYDGIKLVYEFKASDGLKDDSVRKAIQLSQDRYCGVSAMLKKATSVEFDVVYL
jgi:putative redox protein